MCFMLLIRLAMPQNLRRFQNVQKIDSNQDVFDAALDTPGNTATSAGSSK